MNRTKTTLLASIFIIGIIGITPATLAYNANRDASNGTQVENKTIHVGDTLRFEGRDHHSTPCVYYSVDVEDYDFNNSDNNIVSVTEHMVYDNIEDLNMPGGDGGTRHFTIVALKPGKVKVLETRNDCQQEQYIEHNYTIVNKQKPAKKRKKRSNKRQLKR